MTNKPNTNESDIIVDKEDFEAAIYFDYNGSLHVIEFKIAEDKGLPITKQVTTHIEENTAFENIIYNHIRDKINPHIPINPNIEDVIRIMSEIKRITFITIEPNGQTAYLQAGINQDGHIALTTHPNKAPLA